jgi:hypothetical protein
MRSESEVQRRNPDLLVRCWIGVHLDIHVGDMRQPLKSPSNMVPRGSALTDLQKTRPLLRHLAQGVYQESDLVKGG